MAAAGPSAAKGENIRYAAVARMVDRVPVMRYAFLQTKDLTESLFDEKMDRLLRSGRISEKTRLTITDKDVGGIHYDSDPDFLYLVICEREYPQRAAFKFLADLKRAFAEFADEALRVPPFGLNQAGKPMLKDLCMEFNTIENVDKISNVQQQVDEVKNVMQSNISSALKNQENLNILLDKSDAMRNEANAFSRSAATVKNQFWWQNTKLMLIIACLVVLLLLIIVLPIVLR